MGELRPPVTPSSQPAPSERTASIGGHLAGMGTTSSKTGLFGGFAPRKHSRNVHLGSALPCPLPGPSGHLTAIQLFCCGKGHIEGGLLLFLEAKVHQPWNVEISYFISMSQTWCWTPHWGVGRGASCFRGTRAGAPTRGQRSPLSSYCLSEALSTTIFETTRPFQEKEKKKTHQKNKNAVV